MRKGDKLEKHEKALQETQLVKVKNRETLEGKIDIQKVIEIRRAIRRRYGNRTNYHKIFNSWDRHRKGYIDLSDLHYMVNRLGINMNIQEAKVLLASHDLSATKRLTMAEFMDLIFSTNDNMNVDLSKIPYNTSTTDFEPNEGVMEGIQKDAANLRNIKLEHQFKYMLQKSLKELYKEFKEQDQAKTGEVDYETFEKSIVTRAQLPSYIKEDKEMIRRLFDEMDEKRRGKVDYQHFCDGITSFRYVGDTDLNMDLGPEKEEPLHTGKKAQEQVEKKPLLIQDAHKVPDNQLVKIVARTLKVSRILQAMYGGKEKLDQELKAKVKFDRYGNVSAEELEKYLLEVCKEHLVKRDLDKADLEGFLSSLVFSKYKTTDVNQLAPFVFSDDTQISKKIHSLRRPLPPPAEIAENFMRSTGMEEAKIPDERMRVVLAELGRKSFGDRKQVYGIFKEYDHDGDGYISYNDIKEHFVRLQIEASDSEIKRFIELVDPGKKGYLDFAHFATAVNKDMANTLVPLPTNPDTFLYHRDRSNLVPNGEKVRENIEFHKTFTARFCEIRDKLLPDQNMLLSIFAQFIRFVDLKPATRFGATPAHPNTFPSFQPSAGTGMHMSEEQRFHKTGELNTRVEYQQTDKKMHDTLYLAKITKIQTHQKLMATTINERSLKLAVDDKKQVNNRIERLQAYEEVLLDLYITFACRGHTQFTPKGAVICGYILLSLF